MSELKDVQTFIEAYANRAIDNGNGVVNPAKVWADAENMAARALIMGHIKGTPLEMREARERVAGLGTPPGALPPTANEVRMIAESDFLRRAQDHAESGSWARVRQAAPASEAVPHHGLVLRTG